VRSILRPVVAGAVLVFALGIGPALTQSKIAVSYFPGPAAAPIFVASAHGSFAEEGLAVTAAPTEGSVAQITAMLDDKYQIGFGGLDDVIGYDVGQGEVAVAGRPDLFAFMGTDTGTLHLVAAPGIKTVESLKGKTLAVDAKSTGFAFVLYRIAALHGLKPGDYSVLSVGSSQKRFAALAQGEAQAALLFKPVADQLLAKGFADVMEVSSALPHYQAAVALARRSWAEKHRAQLTGFIRAYVAATRWLADPANKAEAIAILMKDMPNLSPAAAQGTYAAAASLGSAGAIGRMDLQGVATVVALRAEYGAPKKKKLGDSHRFYDLSYYRTAMK